MPPRKRKASTKVVAPATKKVRIGDTSLLDEPEASIPTRPKPKETVTSIQDAPKRRGRPPKTPVGETETSPMAQPAVRGRPKRKAAPVEPLTEEEEPLQTDDKPKKRGRPRKPDVPEEPAVKKRGRPRKTEDVSPVTGHPAKVTTVPKKKTDVEKKAVKAPKKSRAIPTKGDEHHRVKNRGKAVASLGDIDVEDTSDADELLGYDIDSDAEQSERQYWLMKAEPNDRFENGINVKFSIDDLAAAEAPEPWDGVRNYVARNNMRAMRKGDLAFFYHSNCQVPAIVGLMRISQEHSTDKSAFDPNHPYYDPKSSPSNPKWDCVHVEFVKKFDTLVTLKMLQAMKNRVNWLGDMQLLRQSRLSVSSVTPKEWRFILRMANEESNVGEGEGVADVKDGYESETDGEVNAGPNEELNGVIANGIDGDGGGEGTEMARAQTTSELKSDPEELTAAAT